MTEISLLENKSSYFADGILDHKIEETDLSLTAEENFKRHFNKLKEFFFKKKYFKIWNNDWRRSNSN